MLKDRKTGHKHTDRQTDGHTDTDQQTTHIHGQTDRQIQTNIHKDRDRYRQTDIQTYTAR